MEALFFLLFALFTFTACEEDYQMPQPNDPQPGKGSAPIVNVGADKEITLPNHSLTLLAIVTDDDNDIATILWQQISGPSTALMNGQSQTTLNLTQLKEGIYQFALIVSDQKGNQSRDEVNVIVKPEKDNTMASRLHKIAYSANDMQVMR